MKTIKVSEATNVQLDWLVAKCEMSYSKQPDRGLLIHRFGYGQPMPKYTTDWFQMGPIVYCFPSFLLKKWMESRPEIAYEVQLYDGECNHVGLGPTMCCAAARAYVISKLGDTVEVPEELT